MKVRDKKKYGRESAVLELSLFISNLFFRTIVLNIYFTRLRAMTITWSYTPVGMHQRVSTQHAALTYAQLTSARFDDLVNITVKSSPVHELIRIYYLDFRIFSLFDNEWYTYTATNLFCTK